MFISPPTSWSTLHARRGARRRHRLVDALGHFALQQHHRRAARQIAHRRDVRVGPRAVGAGDDDARCRAVGLEKHVALARLQLGVPAARRRSTPLAASFCSRGARRVRVAAKLADEGDAARAR